MCSPSWNNMFLWIFDLIRLIIYKKLSVLSRASKYFRYKMNLSWNTSLLIESRSSFSNVVVHHWCISSVLCSFFKQGAVQIRIWNETERRVRSHNSKNYQRSWWDKKRHKSNVWKGKQVLFRYINPFFLDLHYLLLIEYRIF